MSARPYKSRHDAIGDLPLVTESAEVVRVERVDRDRRPEVRSAVERLLATADIAADLPAGWDPDDWAALCDRAAAADPRLARRVRALADRGTRSRPATVRVRLRTDRPVEYLAGQYVGLRYDDTARAYSLASSPTAGHLELCVRRVPGGRLSPRLCDDLSRGDRVTLRGPYGDLVLDDPSGRDLAFLATGTGVAPLKGMIDSLFETGEDVHDGGRRTVWLFLGAAWVDDLPYRSEFRRRAREHEHFQFVPTVSREPYLADWDGETDYVQDVFPRYVDPATVTDPIGRPLERRLGRDPAVDADRRIDPGNLEVYACGINAMVHGLVETATALGVPEEHVESEGFG